MTFGKRIKSGLEAVGISQSELARRIGVSRATVSEWISDKYGPSRDLLLPLAEILGLDVRDLLRPDPTTHESACGNSGEAA